MTYGYFRPRPRLPRALIRNRNAPLRSFMPGQFVRDTVWAIDNPDTSTVLAMALDHYNVTTLDALAAKMDPTVVDSGPRTMEAFCQNWWGKSYEDSKNEILLTERILNLIRQASKRQAPEAHDRPMWYEGGDMSDTCIVSDGRRVWNGSDVYIQQPNAVNLETNVQGAATLPARNHLLTEFLDGQTDRFGHTRVADAVGGGFAQEHGQVTTFITPNQGTYPGTIYWPLGIHPSTNPAQLVYFICWLTTFPGGGGILDHQLEDTHIVEISIFGTINAVATFDVGPGGNFYGDQVLEDTTHTYVYGRVNVPGYGDFTPSYGENPDTDTTYKTVGRVPSGTDILSTGHTGTVFDDYEWWTGSGWSADRANAVFLADQNGTAIEGDSGIAKIGSNHYMLVAQRLYEPKKRVYFSTTPVGPWWNYTNVPTPIIGEPLPGGATRLIQHNKIFTDFPAPAGEVMTIGMQAHYGEGATYVKEGRHIGEADIPYFRSIPTAFGDHAAPPPSNIHRIRQNLVR